MATNGQPRSRGVLIPVAAAMLFSFAALGAARLRINTTNSLPVGLYLVTDDPHAEFVDFCPEGSIATLSATRGYRPPGGCPDGAAPLLKPVIARVGETVSVNDDGIRVGGRLLPNTAPRTVDSAGRPLAPWPQGLYVVSPGSVWVASTYHPNSFDSRYFGPIPARLIRHRLRSLWVHGSINTELR
jgi:conjugative transfer signal peptidase TraF